MPKYIVLKGYIITANNKNYCEGDVIEVPKVDGDRLEKYGYIQSASQKKKIVQDTAQDIEEGTDEA